MKYITVNSVAHGVQKVLLDDEDYEGIKNNTWCVQKCGNKLYATRKHKRVENVVMHRVIMNVTNRTIFVDHIDGNGLNNQKSNLRVCTRSENLYNSGSRKGSKSKFKGVAWITSHNMWRATIRKDYKLKMLGYFHDEAEAARAYDKEAMVLHGEFANLNFPDE